MRGLLVIDEVGYLRRDARQADLLYEVVRQRDDFGRSIVVTTTNPSPSGTRPRLRRLRRHPRRPTLSSRRDRRGDGESYRKKEAEPRARIRRDQRRSPRTR